MLQNIIIDFENCVAKVEETMVSDCMFLYKHELSELGIVDERAEITQDHTVTRNSNELPLYFAEVKEFMYQRGLDKEFDKIMNYYRNLSSQNYIHKAIKVMSENHKIFILINDNTQLNEKIEMLRLHNIYSDVTVITEAMKEYIDEKDIYISADIERLEAVNCHKIYFDFRKENDFEQVEMVVNSWEDVISSLEMFSTDLLHEEEYRSRFSDVCFSKEVEKNLLCNRSYDYDVRLRELLKEENIYVVYDVVSGSQNKDDISEWQKRVHIINEVGSCYYYFPYFDEKIDLKNSKFILINRLTNHFGVCGFGTFSSCTFMGMEGKYNIDNNPNYVVELNIEGLELPMSSTYNSLSISEQLEIGLLYVNGELLLSEEKALLFKRQQ